jgi:hypothetical protein
MDHHSEKVTSRSAFSTVRKLCLESRARFQNDFPAGWVGPPPVPLTKQESQTLVPSFSVKSTLRFGSISAPHFPQRSWVRSGIKQMVLAARGGFQVGQTAKARQGHRVQSLPVGRDHQSWITHPTREYPRSPDMESGEACRKERRNVFSASQLINEIDRPGSNRRPLPDYNNKQCRPRRSQLRCPGSNSGLARHAITITAKAYFAESRLHTPVRFAESSVPGAQHYDDEISSLIGDDTGWPSRIR